MTATQFSKTGVVGAQWTNLPNSVTHSQFAVSRDGSRLYYGNAGGPQRPIHTYNLQTSSAEADLSPGFAGEILAGDADGCVDVHGNIVFCFYTGFGSGSTNRVRVFSPAGAVLQTFTLAADGYYINHFSLNSDSNNSVMLWLVNGYGGAKFRVLSLDTGATLSESTAGVTTDSGISNSPGTPFKIADSCPLLVSPVPLLVCPPALDPTSCWSPYTIDALATRLLGEGQP
jgi:hypothetical protein